MGNITSGAGNNTVRADNSKQGKTPLNKFVDKVINEKYFILPEYNENSIKLIEDQREINIDNVDYEHNKVMLKRAFCTFRDKIAIDLPHSDGSVINDYSVLIDIIDHNGSYLPRVLDGVGLPNIINSTAGIDTLMCNSENDLFVGIDSNLEKCENDTTDRDKEAILNNILGDRNKADILNDILFSLKRLEFNSLIGQSEFDNQYTSRVPNLQDSSDKNKLNIGSNKCNMFYYNSEAKGEKLLDSTFYKRRDKSIYQETYGGFCGKVLLQNRLNGRRSNNQSLFDYSESTFTEHDYIVNNYDDCNCLNSEFNIIDIELDKSETNPYSNLTYTQGLDSKCKNNSFKGKYNFASAQKLPQSFCLNYSSSDELTISDAGKVKIQQSCNIK